MRSILDQPLVLDVSIIDRTIEGLHEKADKGLDETEYDGHNVQLNVYKQSYGEKSITAEYDNVTKKNDHGITKTREILEKTASLIRGTSTQSERQKPTT